MDMNAPPLRVSPPLLSPPTANVARLSESSHHGSESRATIGRNHPLIRAAEKNAARPPPDLEDEVANA